MLRTYVRVGYDCVRLNATTRIEINSVELAMENMNAKVDAETGGLINE